MRESLFLFLGNLLPRLTAADALRWRLYRLAGLRIEARCTIFGPLTLRPIGGAGNVSIGAGTFVNSELRLGAPAPITIGRNVLIGPRVAIETGGHGLRHAPGIGRGNLAQAVRVEDEVWIGAGAILTPGITVGRGAVVAAGAVVVDDVAPHTLVGGVPARFIREI